MSPLTAPSSQLTAHSSPVTAPLSQLTCSISLLSAHSSLLTVLPPAVDCNRPGTADCDVTSCPPWRWHSLWLPEWVCLWAVSLVPHSWQWAVTGPGRLQPGLWRNKWRPGHCHRTWGLAALAWRCHAGLLDRASHSLPREGRDQLTFYGTKDRPDRWKGTWD